MVKQLPPTAVLAAYGYSSHQLQIEQIGNGLINQTWKLSNGDDAWVLQRINETVFKEPDQIASNIQQIAAHLTAHAPNYLFTKPIQTIDGKEMVLVEEGYYRSFPFIAGSKTIDVVQTAEQAFEAAFQFGQFTALLNEFDVSQLATTIPQFHDLTYRYEQFQTALQIGDVKRIAAAKDLIDFLEQQQTIVTTYQQIQQNPAFKLRVTHHDTKISNVLFDATDHGLCVIDLDTVMPGYFISDVGDMFRTYLSPVNEDEQQFELIEVRTDMYWAIVRGYSKAMEHTLTETEKGYFFYAATFLIYMQALRFITDYINGDIYYHIQYPMHNFYRAGNQVTLLKRLLEKKDELDRPMTANL